MSGYSYLSTLEALWNHSVSLYKDGNREPDSYFDAEQLAFLALNGLKVMDLYDYVEDFLTRQEPGFATFVAVHDIRRNYFLIEQKGEHADFEIDVETLPAKTDAVDGIVWLPRILPKARGKLQGTLPPEIMYGCGGDRRFFKEHGLHPAEFLQAVWSAGDDDAAVISYVKNKTVTA